MACGSHIEAGFVSSLKDFVTARDFHMADFGNVLITGSNRGLGLEFVRRLAPLSKRIIACCRNPDRADGLKFAADKSAGVVEIQKLDVTNYGQVKSLGQSLAGEPIDLLINNAGVLGPRPENWPQDVDAWRRVLEVNSIAPLKVAESFLESVVASERKIIANITSKMGSIGDNSGGSAYIYRSSKAALNAVMRSLAIDTADRDVVVLLLHPGWVKTDIGNQRLGHVGHHQRGRCGPKWSLLRLRRLTNPLVEPVWHDSTAGFGIPAGGVVQYIALSVHKDILNRRAS
jgi:NAD(P)-dependent dehydrogenase (short-subunit alcohol dehydrogenase family)